MEKLSPACPSYLLNNHFQQRVAEVEIIMQIKVLRPASVVLFEREMVIESKDLTISVDDSAIVPFPEPVTSQELGAMIK